MDSQNRILIGTIIVLSLIAAGVYLTPAINEKLLQPQPLRAWVAIEAAGAGVADIGVVHLDAGTPFVLHAVLEAKTRGGDAVYYTKAPALRFLGADGTPRPVAAESIRQWDRPAVVRMRWFTVEGRSPYLRLAAGEGPEAFELQLFFRPDWPDGWSVPGLVEAAFDNQLDLGSRLPPGGQDFGTLRYHVRIELYAEKAAVLPEQRIASPGPEALRSDPASFATVVAALPNAAAPASRVFGLTEIEPPADASAELRSALIALADRGLAFTRLSVLRDQLQQMQDPDGPWQQLDLATAPPWGDGLGAGDLLRVGERVVVLFRDQGRPGVLDYQDLCFDFATGATVRALADVFSGQDPVLEHQRARR